MANAAPTFSQIADAMEKIKEQMDASPAPSAALKQSLLATYQTLNDALGDIALDDYASAADLVGDAAKQLQSLIDSGTSNADPIQQIWERSAFRRSLPPPHRHQHSRPQSHRPQGLARLVDLRPRKR